MDLAAIETLLLTEIIGSRIIGFKRVDSTNDAMRRMLTPELAEGAVVIAEEQSSGRGRFQRRWIAEPGASMLLSILLRPPFPEDQIPMITFLASLSVAKTIERIVALTVELRWPNDVYINEKKVCGILAERTGTAVILGIGINVNQREFPAELRNATSLANEAGHAIDRGTLLHLLLRELDDEYSRARRNGLAGILEDWRSRCTMIGKHVAINLGDEIFEGTVSSIADDGALIIRDASGIERKCYAGEATLKTVNDEQ